MSSAGTSRTGLLVLRIWREPEGPDETPSVRARITSMLDVTSDRERTEVSGSIDDIVASVRTWLENYLDCG
jgi:hypothetical protein